MNRYGCIGKRLTHSFSKEIHESLADYEYDLIELTEEEVAPFLAERSFNAINVTIPYKETVIPYLDEISHTAVSIGAVNTIVNRGGRLYGYNTDYYGMRCLIEKMGLSLHGKKVLVLGTGGTSKTARVVAAHMGAAQILTVSRQPSGEYITYEDATAKHGDAQIIINTTPLGMYPDCDASPIDLSFFSRLEGVVDAVYNPLSTRLVSQARRLGVLASGGLYMLVMQAVGAVEKFLGAEIAPKTAELAYRDILASKENIVLIGMPGCGKTTVSRLLKAEGYETVDTDAEIERIYGCTIKELIAKRGEKFFRDAESEVIHSISRQCKRIISTGGGAILREENVDALKQNGRLFFIDAPLSQLKATHDRPLSDTEEKLTRLYNERIDIYRAVADVTVPYRETPEATAEYILTKRLELIS